MAGALQRLSRQFGLPHGPLGGAVGIVMAVENVRPNRLVAGLLDAGSADRVLEVGCGPGVALELIARSARFAAGVDPSPVMVRQARRRLRGPIASGRAQVVEAAAERLPFEAASFSLAFAVNSVQHWDRIPDGLAELHRVLEPGGKLLLALRGRKAGGSRLDPHAHGASAERLALLGHLLAEAGFGSIERDVHELPREALVTFRAIASGGGGDR